MGTRADVAEVISSCRWSEEGSYLGEILKSAATASIHGSKNGSVPSDSTPAPSPTPMCCIVKVLRGQYQNIGHPSFSNPSLVSHLLLVSAGKQSSIAAQCVKFKTQGQRVAVPFGPTLAIPASFEGHFEILSEDGKSVPVISSVEGLARKFPDSCLVRESIKGYKADTPSVTNRNLLAQQQAKSSNDPLTALTPPIVAPEVTPYYRISDKNRTVHCGEVLVLVGEVSVPSPSGKKVTRYLRCFDSKGQSVYLNTAQKGKFSPLARQDSISGVHTTKNLLNKRMPMMVRLVDGKPPVIPNKSHSSFKKFTPELRLFSTIQEELIFGMPLSQNSKEPPHILPLPVSAPLKFQVCCNFAQVEQMKEFCRLHEKMRTMMDVAKNLIQIYDINLKRELRFDGKQWKAYSPPIFFSSTPTGISSGSTDNASPPSHPSHELISTTPNPYNNHNYDVPDVQDYEDIDQIYDYVRGVKPIPKSSHVQHYHPKIQHPTTQLVISQVSHSHGGSSSSKQKVSRTTTAAGVVGAIEKKESRQSVSRYMEEQLAVTISISKDDQLLREPIKPPRKLSSSSRPLNAMRLRRSLSEDRLLDIDVTVVRDEKPEPPPIETIPTHKNNLTKNAQPAQRQRAVTEKENKTDNHLHRLFNDDDDNDDGFNANYGHEPWQDDELYSGGSQGEDEYDSLKVTVRHAKEPVIRNPLNFNHRARKSATRSPLPLPPADDHYQEIAQDKQDEQTRKLIQKQRNTSKVLISCESSPNNTNTTNTNTTSSSGVSSGEVGAIISIKANDSHHAINCANDHASIDNIDSGEKGKVKKHHYIKRNSKETSPSPNVINICSSPSPICATPAGVISGSPSNRIIFRRSPIFDCRYKSMNDLNRGSLESSASGSSSSGGGLGSKLSRYFQFSQPSNHNHNHQNGHYHQLYDRNANNQDSSKQFGSSSSGYLSRGSPHYHSNSNINVNLLNLNIKASSRHKALFRPKSLTNLMDIAPASVRGAGFGFGLGKLGGAGKSSCRKKLLDNMVMPSHHHGHGHAHVTMHSSVPSFDVFQKLTSLSSSQSSKRNSYCSSGGGNRKHSNLPSLYL